MEKRVCRTCNEEKDVSCFPSDRNRYRLDCGKCYYQKYKENRVEYYEANKEEYNKKRGETVTCECGCVLRIDNMIRHKKTNKHLDLMTKK
jgi:hypothetical protein